MKPRLSYSDGISVVPLNMTVEQLRREDPAFGAAPLCAELSRGGRALFSGD